MILSESVMLASNEVPDAINEIDSTADGADMVEVKRLVLFVIFSIRFDTNGHRLVLAICTVTSSK